jgi:formate-dependent nitrite reductase membrane component NrfD
VPAIGLVFLLLTSLLLVFDLKRPERFLYLVFKPNPRSWLVLGGVILFAAGVLGTLWLLAGLVGSLVALHLLAWPTAAVAAATAGYSAFLFGQAEGRDFWQSPLLLPQLLVAALVAGGASLILLHVGLGGEPQRMPPLVMGFAMSLVVHGVVLLAELFGAHANVDVSRAARLITRGGFRASFWLWVVGAGVVVPLLLIWFGPAAAAVAALLSLAGLWVYEDLWVKAGQSLPLS